MSTDIENRIVQMAFENKDFEKGVRETIDTLDKLEKSLNFGQSVNGVDKLNTAFNSMSANALGGVSKSLDEITSKFTLLGQIGYQALQKIAGKAADMAIGVGKSLMIDPWRAGLSKYGEKNVSLAALKAALPDTSDNEIEKALSTLQTYSDETSYSYTQMIEMVQRFVNNGVSLENAVAAITGIGNEAAYSGADIQKGIMAMSALSKSLSKGSVALMEWRQLETYNIATKDFKKNLIDAAVAAGKLKKDTKTGVAYFLKKGKKITVDVQNLADTLKYDWLDAQSVLVPTLKKYTQGTGELGDAAYAAAQNARTLSQALDAVKDAASSAWMTTFEHLFGNLEESTAMFTFIASELAEIIGVFDSVRNNFLENWANNGGRDWIFTHVKAGEKDPTGKVATEDTDFGALVEILGVIKDLAEKAAEAIKIIMFPFGNNGSKYLSIGESLGLNRETRQEIGLTSMNFVELTKNIYETIKSFREWLNSDIGKGKTPLTVFRDALVALMAPIDLARQASSGLFNLIAKLLSGGENGLNDFLVLVSDVANTIYKYWLYMSADNVIGDFFSNLGDAIKPLTDGLFELFDALVNVISGFFGVDSAMDLNNTEQIKKNVSNLKDSLKKFTDWLKPIFTWLGDRLRDVAKFVRSPEFHDAIVNTLNAIKTTASNVWKAVGPILQKVWNWIVKIFNQAKSWLTDPQRAIDLMNAWDWIKDKAVAIWAKLGPILDTAWKGIQNFGTKFGQGIDNLKGLDYNGTFGENLHNAIVAFMKPFDENFEEKFDNFLVRVQETWNRVTGWIDEHFGFITHPIGEFFGLLWDGIKKFFTMGVSDTNEDGSQKSFMDKLEERFTAFNELVDWVRRKIDLVKEKINEFLSSLGIGGNGKKQQKQKASGASSLMKAVDFIFGIGSANAEDVETESEEIEKSGTVGIDWQKIGKNILDYAGFFMGLFGVVALVSKIASGIKGVADIKRLNAGEKKYSIWTKLSLFFVAIAGTLLVAINVIERISEIRKVQGPEAVTQAVLSIVGVIAAFTAASLLLMLVANKKNAKANGITKAFNNISTGIFALATGLLILWASIKLFASMSNEEFISGGWKIVLILIAIIAFVEGLNAANKWLNSRFSDGKDEKDISDMLSALGKSMLFLSLSMLVFWASIKLFARMSPEEFESGGLRVLAVLGAALAFIVVLELVNSLLGKNMKDVGSIVDSIGKGILKLAAGLAVIGLVIVGLSLIPQAMWDAGSQRLAMIAGGLALFMIPVSILISTISKFMETAKDMSKGDLYAAFGVILLSIISVVGVLVGAFALINAIDPDASAGDIAIKLLALSGAILIISAACGLFIKGLSKMPKHAKMKQQLKAVGVLLVAMAGSLLVAIGAIVLLNAATKNNPLTLDTLGQFAILSGIALMLTVVGFVVAELGSVLSKISPVSLLKGLAVLGLAIAAIGAIVVIVLDLGISAAKGLLDKAFDVLDSVSNRLKIFSENVKPINIDKIRSVMDLLSEIVLQLSSMCTSKLDLAYLNSFNSVLMYLGSSLNLYWTLIQNVDIKKTKSSIVEFKAIAQELQKASSVEIDGEKIASLRDAMMRTGAALLIYSALVKDVDHSAFTSSKTSVDSMMDILGKLSAKTYDIALVVTAINSGVYAASGLYLYGTTVKSIAASVTDSELKMAESVSTNVGAVADGLSHIASVPDKVIEQMLNMAAALKIYYMALSGTNVETGVSLGEAIYDANGDIRKVDPEIMSAAFDAIANAMPSTETIEKIEAFATTIGDGGEEFNPLNKFALGIANIGTALEAYGQSIATAYSNGNTENFKNSSDFLGIISELQSNLVQDYSFMGGVNSSSDAIGSFATNIITLGGAVKEYGEQISKYDDKAFSQSAEFLERINKIRTDLFELDISFMKSFVGEMSRNPVSTFVEDIALLGGAIKSYGETIQGVNITDVLNSTNFFSDIAKIKEQVTQADFEFVSSFHDKMFPSGSTNKTATINGQTIDVSTPLGQFALDVVALGGAMASFQTALDNSKYDAVKMESAISNLESFVGFQERLEKLQGKVTTEYLFGLVKTTKENMTLEEFSAGIAGIGQAFYQLAKGTTQITTDMNGASLDKPIDINMDQLDTALGLIERLVDISVKLDDSAAKLGKPALESSRTWGEFSRLANDLRNFAIGWREAEMILYESSEIFDYNSYSDFWNNLGVYSQDALPDWASALKAFNNAHTNPEDLEAARKGVFSVFDSLATFMNESEDFYKNVVSQDWSKFENSGVSGPISYIVSDLISALYSVGTIPSSDGKEFNLEFFEKTLDFLDFMKLFGEDVDGSFEKMTLSPLGEAVLGLYNDYLVFVPTDDLVSIANALNTLFTAAIGLNDTEVNADMWSDVSTSITYLTDTLKTGMDSAVSMLKTYRTTMVTTGVFVISGFTSGITSRYASIYNACYTAGTKAIAGLQDGVDAHSPSVAAMRIAGFTVAGYVAGMDESMPQFYKSGKQGGKSTIAGLMDSLGTVGDVASDIGGLIEEGADALGIKIPVDVDTSAITDSLKKGVPDIVDSLTDGGLKDVIDGIIPKDNPLASFLDGGISEDTIPPVTIPTTIDTNGLTDSLDTSLTSIVSDLDGKTDNWLDIFNKFKAKKDEVPKPDDNYRPWVKDGVVYTELDTNATVDVVSSTYAEQHKAMIQQADNMAKMQKSLLDMGNRMTDTAKQLSSLRVVLDSGVVVGELAPKMDSVLGESANA